MEFIANQESKTLGTCEKQKDGIIHPMTKRVTSLIFILILDMTFVHDEIDAMTQLLFVAAFAVLFIQEEASLWQQFHIMEFHCYWSSQLSTINSQRHKSK